MFLPPLFNPTILFFSSFKSGKAFLMLMEHKLQSESINNNHGDLAIFAPSFLALEGP